MNCLLPCVLLLLPILIASTPNWAQKNTELEMESICQEVEVGALETRLHDEKGVEVEADPEKMRNHRYFSCVSEGSRCRFTAPGVESACETSKMLSVGFVRAWGDVEGVFQPRRIWVPSGCNCFLKSRPSA